MIRTLCFSFAILFMCSCGSESSSPSTTSSLARVVEGRVWGADSENLSVVWEWSQLPTLHRDLRATIRVISKNGDLSRVTALGLLRVRGVSWMPGDLHGHVGPSFVVQPVVDGAWEAHRVQLTMPGRWQVRLRWTNGDWRSPPQLEALFEFDL